MKTAATISRLSAERGQTMVLAALAMATLFAMAALAIDIVTLYVAKGEIQRAADAALPPKRSSIPVSPAIPAMPACKPWPRTSPMPQLPGSLLKIESRA